MEINSEDFSDKVSDSISPIREYIPYFAAALVILLIILGIYYLYPRPASLTVSISTVEGGTINSSIEVFVTDISGNPVGSSNGVGVTSGGLVTFTNLPSGQPLTVSANAGPSYNPVSIQITLDSGSSSTINIPMELANNLIFSNTNIPNSITSDCVGNFYVTLQNNASSSFQAQLIASGDSAITQYVSVDSISTIPPYSSKNFSVNFRLPQNQPQTSSNSPPLNLNLRVKGTNVQQSFPLTLLSAQQVTLNPSTISITDTASHVFPITLINSGGAPLTGFNFGIYTDPNLASICQADGSGCFSINLLSSQNLTAIPADSQITFELDDKGLSNLPAGTYLAQLQFTANCIENPGIIANIQIQIPSAS